MSVQPETEFKEFKRLKYGWFHLKMFQDLGRRSIETGFWRIEDVRSLNSLNLDTIFLDALKCPIMSHLRVHLKFFD